MLDLLLVYSVSRCLVFLIIFLFTDAVLYLCRTSFFIDFHFITFFFSLLFKDG